MMTLVTPAFHADLSPTLGDRHASLVSVIVHNLRQQILDGTRHQGDRLVEGKLSAELGVSRVPVREALRQLASEGLVDIEPRRGASVTRISDDIAVELIEVRATLEGLNAKLAAQRRDPDKLPQLYALIATGDRAAQAEDVDALAAINARAHELIATVAENRVLQDLMRSLRDRTALLFAPYRKLRARPLWIEHAQILQAVIDGDADLAGLLATRHVYSAARTYLDARGASHGDHAGHAATGS
ncbi:transcriptional regulator, GntR family [Leptothrix cholodnii SP-6]|uniref:Transcriptional regulator, GntR family n=1 Tax=Leptothrix cholodnii (strain ATCC 51168 / LMG 8142 / SP-6) TaxID=395495 RepID=B1Y0B7_LEPCP|nr:GntR family transcriptional regulator [Leptothrix cholodnii]ACB36596.1 transcriptional regulator, GntR family [Leptothrix cholodnii SP-6]